MGVALQQRLGGVGATWERRGGCIGGEGGMRAGWCGVWVAWERRRGGVGAA